MQNNISKLRRQAGLSQSELAAQVGTTLSMMGKIERGERELNQRWLEKLGTALGRPVTALLAADTVPVVGYVGAGARVHAFDDTAEAADRDEVIRPPMVYGDVAAVEVRGESMFPLAEEGWHILYAIDAGLDEKAVLNRVCVVELEDGTMLVKRVSLGTKPKHYHLVSINAPTIPDVRIRWAAPVKAIIPR